MFVVLVLVAPSFKSTSAFPIINGTFVVLPCFILMTSVSEGCSGKSYSSLVIPDTATIRYFPLGNAREIEGESSEDSIVC